MTLPYAAKAAHAGLVLQALICTGVVLISDALAQADDACHSLSVNGTYWRGCRDLPARIADPYCVGCQTNAIPARAERQQHAVDLTDQDVLLFLSYGLSDRLAAEIDAAAWQGQSPSRSARDPWLSPHTFSLRWRGDRFEEPLNRADLMGYLQTVLPADQLPRSSTCRDCEFTMAMGMVWGYRWSTLSGRLATDTRFRDLARAPNYGFRFLHRASPKWRYVLAVDRENHTLDIVGEAQWRIRPDAYVRLTTGFADEKSFAVSNPDLRFYFSFE